MFSEGMYVVKDVRLIDINKWYYWCSFGNREKGNSESYPQQVLTRITFQPRTTLV